MRRRFSHRCSYFGRYPSGRSSSGPTYSSRGHSCVFRVKLLPDGINFGFLRCRGHEKKTTSTTNSFKDILNRGWSERTWSEKTARHERKTLKDTFMQDAFPVCVLIFNMRDTKKKFNYFEAMYISQIHSRLGLHFYTFQDVILEMTRSSHALILQLKCQDMLATLIIICPRLHLKLITPIPTAQT